MKSPMANLKGYHDRGSGLEIADAEKA